MDSTYDVAVIGGGPAGSTAATFLARQGRKVVVIEREKFPRFHIGESLLPYSMDAFDRLGIRDQLDRAFLPKYGAEIATSCGRSLKVYFKNGFRLKHHSSYQVPRAEFDQLLLDNARASGAEVREETTVEGITFTPSGNELMVKGKGTAAASQVHARYVIDCSGRNTVIGNARAMKTAYEHLRKFSVYAHYDGVVRDEGIDNTLTRIVRGRDRWFWMIPLTADRTSVGVVMDSATFKQLRHSPEQVLDDSLREQNMMWDRMTNAVRVSPVYSAGDYSYRNESLAGDRWILAGDAAGFIDPIFSTGVFLAILSGEEAANAVDAVLRDPAVQPRLFKRYERKLNRVMKMYLKFVTSWYEDEFIEIFCNPTERFELVPAINAILAGNIGTSFAIKWRLWLFYFFVRIQRFFPLCPRLTLQPQKQCPVS